MSTREQTTERKQNLLTFLKPMTRQEREDFAQRIGTTLGQLLQIGYGKRPCSPVYAVNIDRETGGKVTMQEMCPEIDWDHVYSAMRGDDVEIDYERIKQRVHGAVNEIDFGKRAPVRRRESHVAVQQG